MRDVISAGQWESNTLVQSFSEGSDFQNREQPSLLKEASSLAAQQQQEEMRGRMRTVVWLLATGMLVAGTINTISTKYQVGQASTIPFKGQAARQDFKGHGSQAGL